MEIPLPILEDDHIIDNDSNHNHQSKMNGGNNRKWFVAVHCGAGIYSKGNVHLYKDLMKQACRVAASQLILTDKCAALDACCESIAVLENSEHTNAGLGSNLNEKGNVECDACVALYTNKQSGYNNVIYGSVGAIYGVYNPIMVAKELIVDCRAGLGTLGRIKPLMLCGRGAYLYARDAPNCRHLIVERDEKKVDKYLITAKSLQVYNNHTNRIKQYGSIFNYRSNDSKDQIMQNTVSEELFYDTVGSICYDIDGNLSAGVSSGGISLKYPGRVGEAAIYGSGCFVNSSFACSCTGLGEDIMLNQMASRCAWHLEKEKDADLITSIKTVLSAQSPNNGLLPHHTNRNAGILACHVLSPNRIELAWSYTTKSMAVAYMSSTMKDPVAFVSFHRNYNPTSCNIQIASLGI
jgi:taspase (threonine aspartase 1)